MRQFLIGFLALGLLWSCKSEPKNTKNSKIGGAVFGTTYSVIYDSAVDYEKQFDSLFYVINKSMSTYIPDSDISKLNRNENNVIDSHFKKVLESSYSIFDKTEGAFDPTIGAVVNAWSFGPEGRIVDLDSLKIDSLMHSVGLKKVKRIEHTVVKPEGTFIDFNAIAKGYAVDVVAEFLESKSIENYLVEIGGEIRCKGYNAEKQSSWTVGIDKPNFDGSQSVLKAINLEDAAMATSGTYRKFKVDEQGNRFAHIIDTKTGYPSKTNVLSVSVIASECMVADAYATAFQAMGIEKVMALLKNNSEVKVFFVFENENNELETLALNGFPE
ncbi:FAD:protein FMN transferase [Winogradskyella sp. 3972H.M.0a.05]|uniref:FAD:protein FMN transferase n=1 Tax=Winogradskyella sp. 3972H.M.0a.05 TaxID=2950277 RepID=UPI003394E8D9